MPDDGRQTPLVAHQAAAVAAVSEWIARLQCGVRPLGAGDLFLYPLRAPVCGWRLDVPFGGRLDLLLTADFPRVAPRVALVDRPPFLTWPHVEEDGVLCLLPDSASVDFTRPTDVVPYVLDLACALVTDLAAGRRTDDFRTEFDPYWARRASPGAPKLRSLLTLSPPNRRIAVWRGRRFYLLGEDKRAISDWMGNRFRSGVVDRATELGLLLWLDKALLPREYPSKASDVRRIAQSCGAGNLLDKLVMEGSTRILVAMAAQTANGPCLAGVTVNQPSDSGGTATLTRGFRPGKVPRRLLVARYLGGASVMRSTVERADAPWVHGRGQDPKFARLHAAKVVVLGCGSVGAPVALQLAAAGVGHLLLVDPDRLKWANVGRHPLGASDVDRHKSSALADHILASYPHALGVDSLTCRWQDGGPDGLRRFAEADLVISAMGDWAAEGALNEWHLRHRKGIVVYGWTEAHACAGHAVAIRPEWGCFQCGFTHDGLPHLRVTDWPQGDTVRQEPACGAIYQPYGPVELGHVVSVIAELAIDCVLGRVGHATHRIWGARRPMLEGLGGVWTPEWEAIAGSRAAGGFVEEREWPRSSSCIECTVGAT